MKAFNRYRDWLAIRRRNRSLPQELAAVFAVCLQLLSLAVVLSGLVLPISLAGCCLVLAQCFFILAIFAAYLRPWQRISLLMLAGVLVLCVFFNPVPRHPAGGQMLTIPFDRLRTVNTLIREEDGIYLASYLLSWLKGITTREWTGLYPALTKEYRAMREERGIFSTPLVATTFGLQSSERSDLLVFRPEADNTSLQRTLLFLHGVGGNWTLLCYIVSRAASELGIETICPSYGLFPMWGSEEGKRIVSDALRATSKRQPREVYIAGLSAGAVGAVEVARAMPEAFRALILLFGAHPDIDRVGIPTLFVFGRDDERFPAAWIRSFAKAQAKRNSDVEVFQLPGDHFALLKEASAIQQILHAWLLKRVKE